MILRHGIAVCCNVNDAEYSKIGIVSGVARNFRQGVRQLVAFLSVHSRSAALPSRLSLIDKNIGTSARFYA